MGYLVLKTMRELVAMERSMFFFAQTEAELDALKVSLQYEEICERFSRVSRPAEPDMNLRVEFFGKVSSGKTQLIRSLLEAAKSEESRKVTNISAVGGSTVQSETYEAMSLETGGKLLLVDTPGLDSGLSAAQAEAEEARATLLSAVDFCVLVFNGDSDEDLYARYLDAVKAICAKNGYHRDTENFRTAWRRVVIVRTHGDTFGWGLNPCKEYELGWEHWPKSLRKLLETTCERLNQAVLAPNGFDPSLKPDELWHISTKKGSSYGVNKLWTHLVALVSGPAGHAVILEREVSFLEQTVQRLTDEVNTAVARINGQWVTRRVVNVIRVVLGPIYQVQGQSWVPSYFAYLKDDEQYHQQCLRRLEQTKAKLAKAKDELRLVQR
mmetsp:Transcript_16208/g.45970  ORF Transcript_16208/g.45970 Transcript_16208/m.45970 type:complete len:382 (+) Transcript_16208:2-1147(+)